MVSREQALAKLTAPGHPFEIVEVDVRDRHLRVFKNAPRNLRDIYETTRSDKLFIAANNFKGERDLRFSFASIS